MEVPYSMDMKLWQEFAKHAQLYSVQACLASYRLNQNRKNNDNHQKYYKEMKAFLPEKIILIGKILWRQISKIANHSKLFPSIYFDQKKLSWTFRKNLFTVKTFELLGDAKPR
jgi:hypothetical protein